MLSRWYRWLPVLLLLVGALAHAQAPPPPPPTTPAAPAAPTQPPAPAQIPAPTAPAVQLPPPPPDDQVAATVNSQKIFEKAVYRALIRIPGDKRDQARTEVINFLIENAIIDQYLEQLKVQVEPAEVEKRFTQLKAEVEKQPNGNFEAFLKKLFINQEELKVQLLGALRWDKFVEQQAPDKVLQDMFTKNKNMFDQSMVRARHILIKPATNDAAGVEQARARVVQLKQAVDSAATQELSKLPATTEALKREEARRKALDDAFGAFAEKESTCPSKKNRGELGWFPRLGMMVEPFAKTAFALKPYDLSEPVVTEFGVHLILLVDQKVGKDVKYEEVKPLVREVYAERLRDAVLQQMRPRMKIEVVPVKK